MVLLFLGFKTYRFHPQEEEVETVRTFFG